MSHLDVHNVSVQYRTDGGLALSNVSFSVNSGEIVALTGDNGAGKSTLIQVLNGSLRPSCGKVTILGTDILTHPSIARRKTATMRQINSPIRGLTPRQAVIQSAMVRGVSLRSAKSRANELFEFLNMGCVSDAPGETLSGGMRRLTNLAVTLVQGAEIVLLDEPTNDVSPSRRPLLWKLIDEFSKEGTTFLVSTHNIDEAARYSTRQLILSKGEIVYAGKMDERLLGGRWSYVDVPSDIELPGGLEKMVVDRTPTWITLQIPEAADGLSNLMSALQGLSGSVIVRENRGFEALLESYLRGER